MDALDNFDDRLRINRTTPALALEAVSSSNDYILKGIAVLARSRADALAQDLKHYKPRRAPPPRAFTSLPADSAVGIHEYISSFDKLQEHVEESWYYNNNNGYGNEISRCVRRELARLAHVRMNEHGFQWWPLPAPSIPLRPPPAISLAEYKLPRNDRIEIWRVNTADSADNMLLNEERARIDNDQEQDAKGNETILSVATRFVCMSPPPEDIWDGVVRNNNATRAGILLLRNESHELFHPDQNRQQQRMLQQGLLKSRRIRFRLDKPDNIIKHLSYQRGTSSRSAPTRTNPPATLL
ncbi:hypothetical protein BKA62DRAFT_39626 [Auriculariales sp. MPI-PUGE-AT-0066]|nr:hypothetical protein BKA62DRAFT_39626 [Auriculariales sp. MPI-PUGE-AT-0066]